MIYSEIYDVLSEGKGTTDLVIEEAEKLLKIFRIEYAFAYLPESTREKWYKGKGWYYTPTGCEPVGCFEKKQDCVKEAFLNLIPLYSSF